MPDTTMTIEAGAPPDLQTHLARLEAAGLLVRINRAINRHASCILWPAGSSRAACTRMSVAPSCSPMLSVRMAKNTTCRCWSAALPPIRRSMPPALAWRWKRSARHGCAPWPTPSRRW